MTSLIGLFSQAVIVIMILGYISNQNPSALSSVQTQFNRLTCPMPQFQGYPANNQTYNTQSAGNSTLLLTCTTVHTPNGVDYNYGQPAVAIGVFFFPMDYFSEIADKLGAFFVLLAFYLTPINFSIFGYSLAQLSTSAQIAILTFYGFEYIMIGISIYKIVSPYTHVG